MRHTGKASQVIALAVCTALAQSGCGATAVPARRAGPPSRALQQWIDAARDPEVVHVAAEIVSPEVLELSRLPRVARFDASGTAVDAEGARRLLLLELDHAVRVLLPAILEQASADMLRQLAPELRSLSPLTRPGALELAQEHLRRAVPFEHEPRLRDASQRVEQLWSGGGPRPPSRDELAAAALESTGQMVWRAAPRDWSGVCLSGQPLLVIDAMPVHLVHYALGVGLEPHEVEPLVLAMLEDLAAEARRHPPPE